MFTLRYAIEVYILGSYMAMDEEWRRGKVPHDTLSCTPPSTSRVCVLGTSIYSAIYMRAQNNKLFLSFFLLFLSAVNHATSRINHANIRAT